MIQRRGGFESVQYLRALAAIMIVAYHIRPRIERMGWSGYWPEWLGCGVDIFFVISGFIMWMTTCERGMSPYDFLLRRFLRIAPLYYAVTALTVLLMLAAPKLAVSGHFDMTHVIASFAFFPTMHPVLSTFVPVVPQGWTLNYEMEFYTLFAIALLLPELTRRWAIPLALIAIVALGSHAAPDTALGFYTSSIVLEFGFGVLLGVCVSQGLKLPASLSVAFFAVGLIGIVASWPLVEAGLPRVWASGIAGALIVSGAVFFELQRTVPILRIPRLLGDASYSIYLTHGLFLTAIGVVWAKLGFAENWTSYALFIPVAVICALAGGVGVYLVLERRMHKYSSNFARRRQPVVSA